MQAEDDEEGEGAQGDVLPDLRRVSNPKTINPIGERRINNVDDLLNSSFFFLG